MTTTPRYAVLMKTHFWDDFVERRLQHLRRQVTSGDVYVVVDETNGTVGPIPFEHVVRTKEADVEPLDLLAYPAGQVFWYNADYTLHVFCGSHASYEYYILCEYDAVINADMDDFVRRVAADAVDYVGLPVATDFAAWAWSKTCEGVYPPGTRMVHWLGCVSLFSRRSIELLGDRRRALSHRHKAGEIKQWPFCEAFIPIEMLSNGLVMRALPDFGRAEAYNWWPPHHENDLPSRKDEAFIHPVLDERRYIASSMRWADLSTYFDPNGRLRLLLNRSAPVNYLAPLFQKFIANKDLAGMRRLRDMVLASQRPSLAGLVSLSFQKMAEQSSVCEHSRGDMTTDPQGAVDGKITGGYGFHTDLEENPWWMVDLGSKCLVDEVRIFNRLTHRDRARHLSVLTSTDRQAWHLVFAKRTDGDFGGADGRPMVVRTRPPLTCRYVRIQLDGRNFLHLDEVQVFGEPIL